MDKEDIFRKYKLKFNTCRIKVHNFKGISGLDHCNFQQ